MKNILIIVFFAIYSSSAQISIQQIFDIAIKNHFVEINGILKENKKDTLYLICDFNLLHYDSSYVWQFPFIVKCIYRHDYNKWNRRKNSNKIIMYMDSFQINQNAIKIDIYSGMLFFNNKRKAIQIVSHNIVKIYYDCGRLIWTLDT